MSEEISQTEKELKIAEGKEPHADLSEDEIAEMEGQIEENTKLIHGSKEILKPYDELIKKEQDYKDRIELYKALNEIIHETRQYGVGAIARPGREPGTETRLGDKDLTSKVGNKFKDVRGGTDMLAGVKGLSGYFVSENMTSQKLQRAIEKIVELYERNPRLEWPQQDEFAPMIKEGNGYFSFDFKIGELGRAQAENSKKLEALRTGDYGKEKTARENVENLNKRNRDLRDKLDSAGRIELNPS